MARKIELRVVKVPSVNGAGEGAFDYGEMMQILLEYGHREQGIRMPEIRRCMAALKPLEDAIAAKADSVTFTEEQWKTLNSKLEDYPFGRASKIIEEFGLAIEQAEEIT